MNERTCVDLAVRAAAELDHIILGRGIGLTFSRQLQELLERSILCDFGSADLNLVIAMGKALRQEGADDPKGFPQLQEKTRTFVEQLAGVSGMSPSADLATLREICRRLSQAAFARAYESGREGRGRLAASS